MAFAPRRLSSQLILLVSSILLATGMTSGWMTAKKQLEMFESSTRRNAVLMAMNLAERCAYHMVLDDYAGLESLLLQSADSANITRIQVSEPNGFVLGDTVREPDEKPHRGRLGVGIFPPSSFAAESRVEGDELVVWQPVAAGAPLGWLKITFDLSSIRTAEAEAWQEALLFSLFWVACSAGLLLFVLHPLVRSIKSLTVFAGRLNDNKGETIDIPQGSLEIADLASSLNDASLRLYDSDRRMREDREQLRQSEEKYRFLIEKVQAAIVVHDGSGRILDSNPLARKLLGFANDQLVGTELRDSRFHFFRQDETVMPVAEYPVSLVLSSGQPLRDYVVGIGVSGREHISWLLVNAEPEYDEKGSIRQIIVSFINITERKIMEETLREKERHDSSLLRLSKKMELAETFGEVLKAAREEVEEILGYSDLWIYLLNDAKTRFTALAADGSRSESIMTDDEVATLVIKGDPFLEEIASSRKTLVIPDARIDPRTNKEIVSKLGNRTLINVPIILFEHHLGVVGVGTFGDQGVRIPSKSEEEYLETLASHLAVTINRIQSNVERIKAEQAFRVSESRFGELFNKTSIPLCVVNKKEGTLRCNTQFEKTFGYSPEEVSNLDRWWQLAYPDPAYRKWVLETCDVVLQEAIQKNKTELAPVEYRVTCKNGDILTIVVFGSFIGPEDLLLTFFDITARKRAEEELKKLNDQLEARVKTRTAELAAKNDELEKMNRLFVGRELKMAELKKRIKELKNKESIPKEAG